MAICLESVCDNNRGDLAMELNARVAEGCVSVLSGHTIVLRRWICVVDRPRTAAGNANMLWQAPSGRASADDCMVRFPAIIMNLVARMVGVCRRARKASVS